MSKENQNVTPNYSYDYKRLDAFLKSLRGDVHPEPHHQMHEDIAKKGLELLQKVQERLNQQGGRVLDVGCGQGFFLEILKAQGYAPVGIGLGEDVEICQQKGLKALEMDQSFLDFPDEHFNIVWCRHALEHSIFPYFTLAGFNQVLQPGGLLYVETPAPDTASQHHKNKNHYSVMPQSVVTELIKRAGFRILEMVKLPLKVMAGDDEYLIWIAQKQGRGRG